MGGQRSFVLVLDDGELTFPDGGVDEVVRVLGRDVEAVTLPRHELRGVDGDRDLALHHHEHHRVAPRAAETLGAATLHLEK